jgi:aminoglycoside phosphotransferase (APT) family kinase protein
VDGEGENEERQNGGPERAVDALNRVLTRLHQIETMRSAIGTEAVGR